MKAVGAGNAADGLVQYLNMRVISHRRNHRQTLSAEVEGCPIAIFDQDDKANLIVGLWELNLAATYPRNNNGLPSICKQLQCVGVRRDRCQGQSQCFQHLTDTLISALNLLCHNATFSRKPGRGMTGQSAAAGSRRKRTLLP